MNITIIPRFQLLSWRSKIHSKTRNRFPQQYDAYSWCVWGIQLLLSPFSTMYFHLEARFIQELEISTITRDISFSIQNLSIFGFFFYFDKVIVIHFLGVIQTTDQLKHKFIETISLLTIKKL